MSTPSFGQPPAFGAPAPAAAPVPVEEPTAGSSKKTVVIAVAAGVVALGVLGGAAVLVLGTDDTADSALPPAPVVSAEPSAAPSAPATPLPTSAVQGRNVFVPLVEEDVAGEAGGDAVDPVAAAGAAATPSVAPTTAPTTAPVPAPAPPPVTQIVEVPGPVVTETVPGPTVTEPGPVVTTPGPVQTVDRFAYAVEVVSVEDPDLTLDGDSTATFRVNGSDVPVLEGDEFLDVFLYQGYEPAVDPATEPTVIFFFGSSMWSVPTGTTLGLGPR